MLLTPRERHILRTYFNSSYESRQIRSRLKAAGLRYCSQCERPKAFEEFSGLLGVCKPCDARRSREHYANNKAEINRRATFERRINRSYKPPQTTGSPSELLVDDFDIEDF